MVEKITARGDQGEDRSLQFGVWGGLQERGVFSGWVGFN